MNYNLIRTWRNAQLGERIILQIENKSKEMAEEMNMTIEKLNMEASALEEEKEKKAVSIAVAVSPWGVAVSSRRVPNSMEWKTD